MLLNHAYKHSKVGSRKDVSAVGAVPGHMKLSDVANTGRLAVSAHRFTAAPTPSTTQTASIDRAQPYVALGPSKASGTRAQAHARMTDFRMSFVMTS